MSTTAPATKPRVRVVDAGDDPRWDRFVGSHLDGSAHLHSHWLRALRTETRTGQHHLVCEDDAGEVLGVLPLVETRGLPVGGELTAARLASLPRTPVGGPLACAAPAAEALVRHAADLADERGLQLQLKSAGAGTDWSHLGVTRLAWRVAYVVPLPSDPEAIRFGSSRNHARIRTAVRRAERVGLRLRVAEPGELAAWHRLYLDTMRWHAVPARSLRFFEALLAPGGPAELHVVETTRGGRRLVAGTIDLTWSRNTTYAFSGVDRSVFDLRPMDLLLWHSVRRAVERGSRRYDLGEVSQADEGLRSFKQKWGSEEVPLWHHHRPAPPAAADDDALPGRVGAAVRRAWRHVPLPITARVGEVVNARL